MITASTLIMKVQKSIMKRPKINDELSESMMKGQKSVLKGQESMMNCHKSMMKGPKSMMKGKNQ